MSRPMRISLILITVGLISLLAWGSVYRQVRRTTKVEHVVHHRKSTAKPVRQWSTLKLPKTINQQEATTLNQQINEMHFVGSVLIVRDGKITYERQFGQANVARKLPNRASTAYAIDSIQKIATGALVMQQIEQHHLSMTDHLKRFFPEVPHSNEITIRQMLDMTSGLRMDGPAGPTNLQTDDQIVDYDVHHVTFDPALYNQWQYSQVNYNILTGVLKKLTGKSYEQLFNQQVVKRLGLHQTVMMPSERLQVAVAYTGTPTGDVDYSRAVVTPAAQWHDEVGTGRVATSARDLYGLISGIMAGKIISKQAVTQLYQSGSRSTYGGGTYNLYGAAVNHGLGYGYQSMSCVSKDGKNAVIMLSNSFRPRYSFKPFAEQLYLKLFSN